MFLSACPFSFDGPAPRFASASVTRLTTIEFLQLNPFRADPLTTLEPRRAIEPDGILPSQ